MPLIRLHSFTNLSPPLISHNKNSGSEVPLFCCDSFPPGEAKNSITIRYYRSTKRSIAGASGRLLVDPYSWRKQNTHWQIAQNCSLAMQQKAVISTEFLSPIIQYLT